MDYSAATKVLCDINFGTKKEAVIHNEMTIKEWINLTTYEGRERLRKVVSHKKEHVSNRLFQADLSGKESPKTSSRATQCSRVSIFWPNEYLQVYIDIDL